MVISIVNVSCYSQILRKPGEGSAQDDENGFTDCIIKNISHSQIFRKADKDVRLRMTRMAFLLTHSLNFFCAIN